MCVQGHDPETGHTDRGDLISNCHVHSTAGESYRVVELEYTHRETHTHTHSTYQVKFACNGSHEIMNSLVEKNEII